MARPQPTAASTMRLRRLYEERIGYDPIEDDPSTDPADLLPWLKEHREEEREAARLYGPR